MSTSDRRAVDLHADVDFPGSSASFSSPAALRITPAMSAKYWFETLARLPVEIEVASEYRYREPPLDAEHPRPLRQPVGRDR
jgi:glutamine---fructose-6-phosphate transaminase (isomerizing)